MSGLDKLVLDFCSYVGIACGTWFYFKSINFKYSRLLNEIYDRNKNFKNSKDKTPKLISVTKDGDKDIVAINIRGVMSFKQLEDQKDFIKTYFRCKEIEFERKEHGLVNIIVTYDEKD